MEKIGEAIGNVALGGLTGGVGGLVNGLSCIKLRTMGINVKALLSVAD